MAHSSVSGSGPHSQRPPPSFLVFSQRHNFSSICCSLYGKFYNYKLVEHLIENNCEVVINILVVEL